MELKIITLIENQQDDEKSLINEHGLSLYIEFDQKKFLFDTGQTGDFLQNAKKLNISLEDIDFFIVSHGHYDHSSGVLKLMNTFFEKKKMYIGEEFFHEKYKILEDKSYKYNGNQFKESDLLNEKIQVESIADDVTYLTEHILLFKNFQRATKYENLNQKFLVKQEGQLVLDEFKDEMALGLLTTKGLILVVGCSHIGIVNIIQSVMEKVHVPLYGVVGGTHLVDADEERLNQTVEELRKYNIKLMAFSHCTGEQGMNKMKKAFPDCFQNNNTGHRIIL